MIRIRIGLCILVGVFVIIAIRLFYLQIIQGPYYKEKSEKNRIRTFDILPIRGNVLDRDGYILAANDVTFDLNILPSECNNLENAVNVISQLFSQDPQHLRDRLKRAKKRNPYIPVLIKKRLDLDEITKVMARSQYLPGILIEERPRRIYPLGRTASHIIGYVGEIRQDELERLSSLGYKAGDMVGRMGVERLMEGVLRGRRGGSMVETDSFGRTVKEVAKVPPTNGEDVQLTISLHLQEVAEEEMEGKNGAIVCMDPESGEVLAIVSRSGFDPNLFVDGITQKAWSEISKDPQRPLLNRAVSGLYPLGSVFKVVVAIAAMEEGVTNEREFVNCTGTYLFGNREFGCWREHGHGPVNLRRALVESCDYYFYEMGRRLGVDRIALYANMLGLGVNSGSGLLEEKEGVIPSSEWKRKVKKAPWYPGETLSCAIGQGYIAVTPLQVARMMSAIYNGGVINRARFVLGAPEGEREPPTLLPIRPRTLEVVKEALWGVVNEEKGTGNRAAVPGLDVCGKTGTAQAGSWNIKEKDIERIPYYMRDHAWFAAAAPLNDPQLVVVVFVEHGGHGGSAAAPIAKKIFQAYFDRG